MMKEMKQKIILLLLSMLILSSFASIGSVLGADDWPTYHHDNARLGATSANGPVGGLEEKWSFLTGNHIHQSPAVVDGVVYVGSEDSYFYALNATTGAEIWNYTSGNPYEGSSPVVESGIVYAVTTGMIRALNASVGTWIWTAVTSADGFIGHPAVVDGVLYIGGYMGASNSHIYAFNASTGAQKWNATVTEIDSAIAVVDGVVYAASHYDGVNYIYALNASTGSQIWKNTYYQSGSLGGPIVSGGVVYACGYFGTYLKGALALNASTGTQLWNATGYDVIYNTPAIFDGMLIFGGYLSGSAVYALDINDGAEIWRQPVGGYITYSSAAVSSNGIIYVGSTDGILYSLNASTGDIISSFLTGNEIRSSPAITDEVVYFGSLDNRVYALGPSPPPPAPNPAPGVPVEYYFRSDTYTTLGESAYGLDTDYTNTAITLTNTLPRYYGFRVWLASSSTIKTELTSGTPEAQISFGNAVAYGGSALGDQVDNSYANIKAQKLSIPTGTVINSLTATFDSTDGTPGDLGTFNISLADSKDGVARWTATFDPATVSSQTVTFTIDPPVSMVNNAVYVVLSYSGTTNSNNEADAVNVATGDAPANTNEGAWSYNGSSWSLDLEAYLDVSASNGSSSFFAVHIFVPSPTGSYSAEWSCPGHWVTLGYQTLEVTLYTSEDGGSWSAIADYISSVLITKQIEASTWTFTLNVDFDGGDANYNFGNSDYRSGISGVVFTDPLESEIQLWRVTSGDYVGFVLGAYIDVIGEAFYVLFLLLLTGVFYFRYRSFGPVLVFFALFGGSGGLVWLLAPPFAATVISILLILGAAFIVWRVIR
jgi:outer membrane protein assembly factor BamB